MPTAAIHVGIGAVTRIENREDLARYIGSQSTSLNNVNVEAAHKGPTGVNVAVSADREDGSHLELLVLVGRREGEWTIAGLSHA